MIFVTVGSQKFQFNRLLIEIDRLIEERKITEEVFAQIGYSDYEPKNYKYKKFLDRDEFSNIIEVCDKVICHGGTGAIVNAVKSGKKVIAVPRLAELKEHVDNHQLQIVNEFNKMGFVLSVYGKISNLEKVIVESEEKKNKEYISNTGKIIESIEEYICII